MSTPSPQPPVPVDRFREVIGHHPPLFGSPLVDAVIGKAVAEVAAANVGGAALVFGIVLLAFPEPYRSLRVLLVEAGTTLVYLAVSGLLLRRRVKELVTPVVRPLAEQRPPDGEERRLTLRLPWPLLRSLLAYWSIAAVFFLLLDVVVLGIDWWVALRLELATLLTGATTCTLAFQVLERALRPVMVVALGGEPPAGGSRWGIGRRMQVTWVLGSGVVFGGIAFAAVVSGEMDRGRFSLLVGGLALVGLFAGLVTTRRMASSVAQPLEALRQGMLEVQRGHFDAQVTVDDAGEIGFLEAGFNNMVQGLREREQLREEFGRLVGHGVAAQALQRTGLGGEPSEVSVLFIDMIGSTALAEKQPAEQFMRMLNEMFAVVVQLVGEEGGWVNKFEGDAALCVFGAPEPLSQHAAHAARAGRCLRDALCTLQQQHEQLDFGIGISTGRVVAGNVGSPQRYEYTVIGEPVNQAARLADEAKRHPARVLASAAVVAAAGDEAGRWRSEGTVRLRGHSHPTEVAIPADGATPARRRPRSQRSHR